MLTDDNSRSIYQIASAQATRHVIDDVTHHQPPASVRNSIHHTAASLPALHNHVSTVYCSATPIKQLRYRIVESNIGVFLPQLVLN